MSLYTCQNGCEFENSEFYGWFTLLTKERKLLAHIFELKQIPTVLERIFAENKKEQIIDNQVDMDRISNLQEVPLD